MDSYEVNFNFFQEFKDVHSKLLFELLCEIYFSLEQNSDVSVKVIVKERDNV